MSDAQPTSQSAAPDVGISSVTTDSARRDARYEVLDMNSQGMYLCQMQQLDEAEQLLTQAYNLLENDTTINHPQTVDQLRSTTLNNLGVVECHKGLHKQALNHLEVAQTLEQQWNVNSPSVSLNICAACNALGHYARATTAALDTIEMLRQTAKRDMGGAPAATEGASSSQGETTTWKSSPADGENSVLWGAAWHNLAVAQLNAASGKDVSEYTNVLAIFQNAMKATSELLGWDHPMTKAVHETYRSVRAHLRGAGVYKQHHALLTAELPPITGKKSLPQEPEAGLTIMATARKQDKELHISIRGRETNGKKVVERYNAAAYPGCEGTPTAPSKQLSPRNSPRGLHLATSASKPHHASPIRGIPLSGNLLAASTLYKNPHPLLLHPRHGVEYIPQAPTRVEGNSGRKERGGERLPAIEAGKSSGAPSKAPSHDLIADEMWVDTMASTSPRTGGGAGAPQRQAVRPLYAQQLYTLDSTSDVEHRVAQPQQNASQMEQKPPAAAS